MAVPVCLTAPLFTNTGLLTCILYMQKVEGTQLNKSDIVMRVPGQHDVVSVGDAPGWDTGMKPYPEMPSQLSELWDGWCGAGKPHCLPLALIVRGIFAPRAGGCQGRLCGLRSRCGTPVSLPGPGRRVWCGWEGTEGSFLFGTEAGHPEGCK